MFVVDESKLYFISINNDVQEAIKLIEVNHKTDKSECNNHRKIYLGRLTSKYSNINLKSLNNDCIRQETFGIPDITLQPLQFNKKGLSLLNIINNNSTNDDNSDDSDLNTVLITEPLDDVNYTKNSLEPIKSQFIQEVLDLLDDETEAEIKKDITFKSCSYMVCKVTNVCSSEGLKQTEDPDISYHVATHCVQASQHLSFPSQIVNNSFCQLPSIQVVYEQDNGREIFDNIPQPWQPSYVYLPLYENCPCCGQQKCCNNQNYSYYYDNAIPLHESMYAINYEPTSYICPQCGEQHFYQHSIHSFTNITTGSNISNLGYNGIAQTSSNFIDFKSTNNSVCSVCSRLTPKSLKSMATSPIDIAVSKLKPKYNLMSARQNTSTHPNGISINIDLSNPVKSVSAQSILKVKDPLDCTDASSAKVRLKSTIARPNRPICRKSTDDSSNLDLSNVSSRPIPKTSNDLTCKGQIKTNLDLIASRPRKVCVKKSTHGYQTEPIYSDIPSSSSSDSFSSRPTNIDLPKAHSFQASKIPLRSTGTSPIQNTSRKRTCDISIDPLSPRSVKKYLKPVSANKLKMFSKLSPVESICSHDSDAIPSNLDTSKFYMKSIGTSRRTASKHTCNTSSDPISSKPLSAIPTNRPPSNVDVSKIYLKSTGTSAMDLTSLKQKCNHSTSTPSPKSEKNASSNPSVPSKPTQVCVKTSPINVISSDNNNPKPPKMSFNNISETGDVPLCSELSEPMMSISLNSVCTPLKSNKSTCACLNSNNKKTDTANLNSACTKCVSVDLNSALETAITIERRKKKATCKCIDAKPTVSSKTTSVKSEDSPCFSSVCRPSEVSDFLKGCNRKSDKVKELLDEIEKTNYIPCKKNQPEANKIVKFDCSEKSLQTGSSLKMKEEINKLDPEQECKECSLLKDSIVSLIQAVFGIATKPKPCHQQSNVADMASKACKKSCSSCACRQKKKKEALEESFKLNDIIQKAKNKKYGEFKDVCHRIKGLDKVLQDTLLEPYLEYLLDEEMCLHKKRKKVCNICGGRQRTVVSCHYENNPVIYSLARHLKKDQLFDKSVTDYLESLKTKLICNEEYDIDL